jgi:hypothetical protein
VDPQGHGGSYRFEWGTDASFGSHSQPIALGIEPGARAVGGTMTRLTPSTTYLVRLVVTGGGPPKASPAATFTTAAPVGPTTTTTTPTTTTDATPAPAPEVLVPHAPQGPGPGPDQAQNGQAVVLGPESGLVSVKQPGTDEYAALRSGATVPVGSLVNATKGTVRLTSESSAGGRTQDVLVRGGKFEVRQPQGSSLTELALRGGDFSACGRARSSATRKRKPRRSLWAKDRGGKFSTRGLNSVATVRGTTWRVTDTCAGTTTTVYSGSVTVRERRSGRSFVVRKGQRHLTAARP